MVKLKVENLTYSYSKDKKIIDDISFQIEESTVTAILGPNGSGKTTLLKLLLGLLHKDSGSIFVGDKELESFSLKEKAKLMAYVPQKHKVVFAYKVIDLIAMGKLPYSGIFCMNSKQDYYEANEILEKMGLEYLANCDFNSLSGGEQQLVVICRALLQNASILVLDEPVTGLDYGNQILLLKKIKDLAKNGITCIMTTHYPEHALWSSDNSIFLKKGKILSMGKSDTVITKENLFEIYKVDINILKTELNGNSILTCVPLI